MRPKKQTNIPFVKVTRSQLKLKAIFFPAVIDL